MNKAAARLQLDLNTQNKLLTFNMARLGLMCAILLTTIFMRQEVLGDVTIAQIYGTLGLSFLFAFFITIFWDQTLRVRYFMPSQLLYDLLLTSYLVFLTGVNDSVFIVLYLLNIVFSSVVYQLNGALIIAGLSSLVYAALYYVNVDVTTTTAIYNLAWNELLFLLTALLCGQLMDELKRQRSLLESQSANISNLQVLNDQLLNNIPVGLLVVDKEDYIENINFTALKYLGLEHTPELKFKFYELLPQLKNVIENWKNMPETQRLRFNFRSNNGSKNRFSLQVVEIKKNIKKDSETDIESRKILVLQDITKTLNLEKQLEFESKLAATGQLAAGIAHEIRNPLASISGSIEMLSTNLKIENEQDRKLLEISLREIHRLNKLITEFLEFAKPRDKETSSFSLNEAVLEVIEIVKKHSPKASEAKFNINIPGSIHIHADRERIKQVFLNLFINSIESATDAALQIQVDGSKDAEMFHLQVSDNGQGIPKKNFKKIFDPFFTTKTNGTGLGLATVAQIMKASNGEILVVDAKVGTTFLLKFPTVEFLDVEKTGT